MRTTKFTPLFEWLVHISNRWRKGREIVIAFFYTKRKKKRNNN